MKKFSKSWKSSKKVKKQRKYRYNAPLHTKHKFLGCHLSKELREKHKRRALPTRKGDKVKIVRGQFRKQTGKIERIDLKKSKVYVEGIGFKKRDGSKALYPINPSNLILTEINLDDKIRQNIVKRKIK